MKTLVVTGASGYIGSALARQARTQGWRVIAATRLPVEGFDWIPYELDAAPDAKRYPEHAVLVHLAANTRAPVVEESGEIDAARRLLAIAVERSLRVIFVSSQTARHDAPTSYGRIKARIEHDVLASGGVAVRPGLVYGGAPAGLYAQLVRLVSRLPVLPCVLPAPTVQPIHVDDLCIALLRIADRSDLGGKVLCLGADTPVPIHRFLGAVARKRLRTTRAWLPLPRGAVRAGQAILERAGSRALADRLRSLLDLPRMATSGDLSTLDLSLRSLESGLHPSGDDRRRRCLVEARAFVSYCLGAPAPLSLLKRYVRMVERLHDGRPLQLRPLYRHSWAIALLDRPGARRAPDAIDVRLDGALALAEASPAGAIQVAGLSARDGMLRASVHVAGALASACWWTILRLLAGRPREFETPP